MTNVLHLGVSHADRNKSRLKTVEMLANSVYRKSRLSLRIVTTFDFDIEEKLITETNSIRQDFRTSK